MRKEIVGCVLSVVGKKNPLFQLKDWQKKEISSSSLVFKSLKRRLRWMRQYQIPPKNNKAAF